MAAYLQEYCGYGNGSCNCQKRVGYAIANHRLSPTQLEYSKLKKLEDTTVDDFTESMEHLDDISLLFSNMPKYKNPYTAQEFIEKLMKSGVIQFVK